MRSSPRASGPPSICGSADCSLRARRRRRSRSSVFEIVSQLNRGAALITAAEEREQLAELNLIAGRRAKASTAYASALTYLTAGAALLPEDAGSAAYELTFALELHRAECEFLTGELVEAEARLAALASRAASLPDLATVTRLRVDLFMTLGRSDRAVEVGLDYLRRIGIAWSAHPTREEVRQEYERIWRQLGDRPIEALLDLPRMTDPVACGTMDVLTALVSPALFTDENLRCLVIGRMANLSLEHGNSDASCYAYTALGTVLGPYFGDYKAGFRFGQLGLDLVEQPGMDRFKARVYLAFGNLANPWIRHLRTARPLARHAFDAAQQAGDLTYAAFSCNDLITQLLASGDPLAEVQREAEDGLDFARQARFGLVVDLITAQLQLIRTLRGLTPAFGCFDDAAVRRGAVRASSGGGSAPGDRRLLVLDPQAAGARPRRRPRRRRRGGGEGRARCSGCRPPSSSGRSTISTLRWRWPRSASAASAAERNQAPPSLGRPPPPAPGVGRALPGELREPRRAGRRGDRAHRRPRSRRDAPLRAGHPLGARERLRPQRGDRHERAAAFYRHAGFDQIASPLPAERPSLLSALGRRRQGAATR